MWTRVDRQNVEAAVQDVSLGTLAGDTAQIYKLNYWLHYVGPSAQNIYVNFNSSTGTNESSQRQQNGGGVTGATMTFVTTGNEFIYGRILFPVGEYPNGGAQRFWASCMGLGAATQNPISGGCSEQEFGGIKRPAYYGGGDIEITDVKIHTVGGLYIGAGSVFELWKMTTPT